MTDAEKNPLLEIRDLRLAQLAMAFRVTKSNGVTCVSMRSARILRIQVDHGIDSLVRQRTMRDAANNVAGFLRFWARGSAVNR